MQIKLLLVLLSSLYVAKSYKILVYSAPLSFSHIQFVGRIADILQEAGHDVTVFHPRREKLRESAISAVAKQVIYELPDYMKEKMSTKQFNFWDKNTGTVSFQKKFVSTFTQLQVEVCDLLLSDNHTMDELRNKHFDVGITEMLGACGFGLFDKIGVDHIICASAVGVQSTMNNFFDMPHLTSITPTPLSPYTDKMNFFERTINFITARIEGRMTDFITSKYEKVWSRHGVLPKMEDYRAKINYILSNSDEFLHFSKPTTAKIVHIGGITIPEVPPLTEEFRDLMERKDRAGVVYISLGSLVPTKKMPSFFREAIFHVTRTFPQITFLWKTDVNDTVPAIPNLHTFSWLPQLSILAHPKLLCFVSHAGLNSVLELTRSGKPSILVPIFGDQFGNARIVESKNTTIVLMKGDFNNKTFEAALSQIVYDER
ncbi:hypothetical protein Y032_0003g1180 [Ancylostoma ceylanicum]|uniref:glucuronosyltransferase n=1 Tax=Ancylostoma ceylanicum TaxID=53326 RepID=A0A016VW93_9BILA|nr:hypothetical protein Y032_0003g1180 [Ancylostoma ceylanicum]